jgi:hypothetical protein
MLVNTMTPTEINKEVLSDYLTINRSSTMDRLFEEYHRERKKKNINKESKYPIFKEIKTKAKNKWIFLLNKSENSLKYQDISDVTFVSLTYMSTNTGVRFFKVSPQNDIIVYNEHLFLRYNERMNLNLSSTLDILKHFFINNGHAIYKIISEHNNNGYHSIGFTQNGILLGVHLPEHSWVINRTFIRKDQAYISQKEFEEESIEFLKDLLEKDNYFSSDPIESEIIKNIFVNLTINQ